MTAYITNHFKNSMLEGKNVSKQVVLKRVCDLPKQKSSGEKLTHNYLKWTVAVLYCECVSESRGTIPADPDGGGAPALCHSVASAANRLIYTSSTLIRMFSGLMSVCMI